MQQTTFEMLIYQEKINNTKDIYLYTQYICVYTCIHTCYYI